jgi:hypothetical protein
MILWDAETRLYLFTEKEFEQLPDGIELETIGGKFKVKGQDTIDLDTRMGYLAFGVRNPFEHEHKDLFLLFTLAE